MIHAPNRDVAHDDAGFLVTKCNAKVAASNSGTIRSEDEIVHRIATLKKRGDDGRDLRSYLWRLCETCFPNFPKTAESYEDVI